MKLRFIALTNGDRGRPSARRAAPLRRRTIPPSRSRWWCPSRPEARPTSSGRILAGKLSDSIGQRVIVDNQGGAGGNIGTEYVARAAPDGYTIVLGTVSTHAINASIYSKLPYDPIKDFAPVIEFGAVPQVLVVNSSLPDQVGAGADRICARAARQGHLRLGRQRHHQPSLRRAPRREGKAATGACALSGQPSIEENGLITREIAAGSQKVSQPVAGGLELRKPHGWAALWRRGAF